MLFQSFCSLDCSVQSRWNDGTCIASCSALCKITTNTNISPVITSLTTVFTTSTLSASPKNMRINVNDLGLGENPNSNSHERFSCPEGFTCFSFHLSGADETKQNKTKLDLFFQAFTVYVREQCSF